MSSWAKKRLDEVADLCLGKMLDAAKNKGEELPYLANVNVRWGTFDLDDLRLMRFEPGERERYGLRYGDIVMCEGGEPGRCAIWKEAVPGMMIQKALHRIRARDGLDQRFLYYSFLHMGMTDAFSRLFTGATIKHLPGQNLAKLEVALPCLDVQRLVADRLSDLDDLIDNNRRRIKLLEDSVRLLFDEWFVRLRFPGYERSTVSDGVPGGWVRSSLGQVVRSLEDGDWIETKDQGGDDFRILQISNVGLNDFRETGNLRFISEETFSRLRCREVTPGMLLIARMPMPIGRAMLVTEMPWRMVTAVDVAIVDPDDDLLDRHYLLNHLNSAENLARCEGRTVGATRPRVTRRELAELPLLVPDKRTQQVFREVAADVQAQRHILSRQIDKLRTARDLLLPRLMRGELSV